MKKILVLTTVVLLVLCITVPSHARKVTGLYQERIGNFTGPITGAAQDDNVKASLDLAHTDLDTGLANQEDLQSLLMSAHAVWYVDSGVAGSAGTSWSTAVATIDDAVNLATADVGDLILVAPGHAENLGTTDPDVDKAGLTIIGLGEGEQRPVLSADTSTDIFTIDGDDIRVENLVFLAHTPDVAKGIDVTANSENTIIRKCEFQSHTAGTDEFLIAICIGADADNTLIKDNQFYMAAGNAAEAILFDGTSDYSRIVDNEIFGDYSTACIYGDTTGALVHLVIMDNLLYNGADTVGLNTEPCIEMKSTSTGIIKDNFCICNVATADLAIVAADMYCSGNKYTETEGVLGTEDIGTTAGKRYISIKTSGDVDAGDDLFDVAGGPIYIESFVGLVTTNIQAQATSVEIVLDADTGYTDHDFSTAVDLTGDAAGTRIVFSAANESVLTELAGADGGATDLMKGWFCGEGMIESFSGASSTGAITWYMIWTPYNNGTTVTPQ